MHCLSLCHSRENSLPSRSRQMVTKDQSEGARSPVRYGNVWSDTHIRTYMHNVHTHIRTYIHNVHTYILYIYLSAYKHTKYIYVHTSITYKISAWTRDIQHIYSFIHTYIHTYIHKYIHIHTYIHTFNIHTNGESELRANPYILPLTVHFIHSYIHLYIHTYIHSTYTLKTVKFMKLMQLRIEYLCAARPFIHTYNSVSSHNHSPPYCYLQYRTYFIRLFARCLHRKQN